jgi:transposase
MCYAKLKKVAEAMWENMTFLDEMMSKRRRRVGAKGMPASSKAMAVLIGKILGIYADRQLSKKLKASPTLRKICGLKRAPHHSTFSKFRKRMSTKMWDVLFTELVEAAKKLGIIKGRIVAFDGTDFEAYSNPRRKNPSDSCAAWGYRRSKKDGEKEFLFGYKAHVAIDAESELPVALTVLPGNRHDSIGFFPTFEKLKKVLTFQIQKVLGDCAYYSTEILNKIIKNLGAIPLIPKNKDQKMKDKDFKKRPAVERIFSRAKEFLGLDNLKLRGLWNATIHTLTTFCSMLFAAIGSFKAGYKNWRSIVSLKY